MANGNSPQEQKADGSGAAQESADERDRLARLKAEQSRKIQALRLNRARICEQLARSSNERYTQLLNSELEQIDSELTKLL
jgi:hypothetical protein